MAETLSAEMMPTETAYVVQTEHEHPMPSPLHMTSKLSDEDAADIEAALNEFVEEMMALEGGDSSVMDEEFTGDVPTPRP